MGKAWIDEKQFRIIQKKADKYDELSRKITELFLDDDGEPLDEEEIGELADIGELIAKHFGLM